MNILGLTNIRVKEFATVESLNQFLDEYNGYIISIQPTRCTDGYDWYSVVYRAKTGGLI